MYVLYTSVIYGMVTHGVSRVLLLLVLTVYVLSVATGNGQALSLDRDDEFKPDVNALFIAFHELTGPPEISAVMVHFASWPIEKIIVIGVPILRPFSSPVFIIVLIWSISATSRVRRTYSWYFSGGHQRRILSALSLAIRTPPLIHDFALQ